MPEALRHDNGPELRSTGLTEWCEYRGIEYRYIQPGKPSQNVLSSGSIVITVKRYSMHLSSRTTIRLERSMRSRSRITTEIGRIRPMGICRPPKTGKAPKQRKCPPSNCLLDGRNYTTSCLLKSKFAYTVVGRNFSSTAAKLFDKVDLKISSKFSFFSSSTTMSSPCIVWVPV